MKIRRSKRKRQVKVLCKQHHQPLTLFCVKDKEVLCTQCSLSHKHHKHSISYINKAASYYRKCLERSMESLKNNVEWAEKIIILQGKKSPELKKMVEYRKEEIHYEFKEHKLFLQDEHGSLLKEIEFEELGILSKLRENFIALSDHISTLKDLLREIEDKDLCSDTVLLTHAQSICQRFQNLKCPELFSFRLNEYELSLPPLYSGLDRIMERFQTVVKFDPDTAHPQLWVSEDRQTVQYSETKKKVPASPRRFSLCPAILGFESFISGRHYWEVAVSSEWTLGVCQDSLPRTWQNEPSAVDGLWAFGKYPQKGYVAFGPKKTQYLLLKGPRKIGIFLDCELGEVSFYDVKDRTLIYMFRDSFSKAVWPFFCTGTSFDALQILPASGMVAHSF